MSYTKLRKIYVNLDKQKNNRCKMGDEELDDKLVGHS